MKLGLILVGSLLILISFQNCGSSAVSGSSISDSTNVPKLLGLKVDLETLLLSPKAKSEEVAFPEKQFDEILEYRPGARVFESIVFKRANEYTDLIWVNGDSQIIISEGNHFISENFDPELLREIYVFGKKEETNYLLLHLKLAEKKFVAGIDQPSQFLFKAQLMLQEGDRQRVLLALERTDVEYSHIEFNEVTVSERSFIGFRAIEIEKSSTETLEFEAIGRDQNSLLKFVKLTLDGTSPPVYPVFTQIPLEGAGWKAQQLDKSGKRMQLTSCDSEKIPLELYVNTQADFNTAYFDINCPYREPVSGPGWSGYFLDKEGIRLRLTKCDSNILPPGKVYTSEKGRTGHIAYFDKNCPL